MSEYTMTTGTEPDIDEQHEARIMRRTEDNELTHMVSEIEDGTFVAWDTCARCQGSVRNCPCPAGPKEPAHITEWRTKRFANSFATRGAEPPLPVELKQQERTIDAVLRKLRDEGWHLLPPTTPTVPLTREDVMELARMADEERGYAPHDDDPEGPDLNEDPDNQSGMDLGEGERFSPMPQPSELPTKDEIIALGEESLRQHHPTVARELGLVEDETPEERAVDATDGIDDGLAAALEKLRNAKQERNLDAGF